MIFGFPLFIATGMLAPMLVQMERQIDREIAADNKANGVAFGTQTEDDAKQTTSTSTDTENGLFDTDSDDEDTEEPMLMYGPQPQIITNDLKSLDEMVSSFYFLSFAFAFAFAFNLKFIQTEINSSNKIVNIFMKLAQFWHMSPH